MKDFKELTVWQKSMELALEVYRLAKMLPKEELFALSDQLRRAAVSIPSNIAEGYGRESKNEYLRFLRIARGSKYEMETQLLLCVDLGYFSESNTLAALALSDEIGKMLNVMIQRIQ